ncbi:class I SAM-dependent RNA methyltransferase [Geothermobacter hydrogeniphilus]|uniref:TRAM domain-containing protein n=1 Tax=Geothermobacter hydrogeniphilus TaxID=1969733 RepID=A0A1X0YEA4_9BACT|nr:TRAM domain-containing protein [Geothermobacter hydrogeniphilus]ORJ63447.1 hypothetical protein B5V00_00870 [Geothermobacter hydrogeniphilus]
MIEVRIESLAFGGDGVGRHRGQAVFIPLTAPGDLVHCRVTERRRRYLRGELVELLEAGEGRCRPRCPVFGRCGGCHWQHLDEQTQQHWKERLFSDILRRQLRRDALPLQPLLAARQAWNYRSRVQFKCHALKEGMAIGFFRRGSHFVEAVDHCAIAADAVNLVLPWLRDQLPQVPRPDRVPQVDVGCDDHDRLRLVVHDIAPAGAGAGPRLRTAAEDAGWALFSQSGRKQTLRQLVGPSELEILVDEPPLRLGYGPGGFAQVHLEQNRQLVAAALEMLRLQGDERVLDLFCGMGNLSLPLARRVARVDGVEAHAPSIEQARKNAAVNGIGNAAFFVADAARFLRQADTSYDLVVLDPPRGGARDVTRALLSHRPRRILYISCDPMTLARDLSPLLGQGYRLLSARAADLFPQTYHLESLSLLEAG